MAVQKALPGGSRGNPHADAWRFRSACRRGEDACSRLLAEYFGVGFPVGIKAVLFAPLPSGFHFRSGDVPIRAVLLQHRSQVLPQLFVGWPAEEPIPVVDFINQ